MATFTEDVTNFFRKTGIKRDLIVRKLAFDGFSMLLKRSPVDTGRFRANWRIGINGADLTTTPEPQKAPTPGSPLAGPESTAATVAISTAKWGGQIVLSNNLPYAEPLEKGWSKQAPNGVLQVTLIELKTSFSDTVRSVQ